MKHINDIKLYEKIIVAHTVCFECGEKYGRHKAGICTVYNAKCDICEKETPCTEARDFNYMITEWKDIKELDNKYQINIVGMVRNKKTKYILKQRISNKGYYMIQTRINGVMKHFHIHRLIAIYFIPNPDNKPQVSHLDNNPLNNSRTNLKWETQSENIKYAVDCGRLIPPKNIWTNKKGKESATYKIVEQYTLNGEFIAEYNGVLEASRKTNISKNKIYDYLRKRKYSKGGGYMWRVRDFGYNDVNLDTTRENNLINN